MPERLVGPLEAAVAEPAQDDVLADAQHDEVDVAVAVDVERVGAGDRGQVGDGRRQRREAQRAADRAVVAVQRRRLAAAGEEQLAAPVVVAVERRHAAADEVLEVAVVAVVDAAGVGDEARCARPSGPRPSPRRSRRRRRSPAPPPRRAEPPHERIEPQRPAVLGTQAPAL